MNIHEILWRNEGQVLTPELIVGIIHGSSIPDPDRQIVNQVGHYTDEYKGVTFQVERLEDCLTEVAGLHQQQWDEIERVRDDLDPDYQGMIDRERDGRYVLFTARTKDGELVGNTGCYLFRSMHNRKLSAKEDTMYLAPGARKGLTASKFFDFCERCLVAGLGVEEITATVKTSNKAYLLWERKGYVWTDRVLTKTFDKEDDNV